MAIVSANVQMARSRMHKVKLATTLTIITRCEATFAAGGQRPLELRFRNKIRNLIVIQRQHFPTLILRRSGGERNHQPYALA